MATEPAPVKDKRTLVLFLFGALMLALDLVGTGNPPRTHTYAVAAGENGGGWLLVRDASGLPDVVSSEGRGGKGLREEKKQLFGEMNGTAELPPEISLFAGQPLPINRADEQALQLLPGVGPHLAQEIIVARQRNGNFVGPEDLARVKGIGPVRLQQLQPLVSFQ